MVKDRNSQMYLPIIVSTVIFLVGIILWLFEATYRAASHFWIPEVPFWRRIFIGLGDTFYIPIFAIFGSVVTYVLLYIYTRLRF